MKELTSAIEDLLYYAAVNFTKYKPHEKQRLFHAAGAKAKERLFLAGNRTGKTYCGIMEGAIHLTGNYPKWWQGKRFTRPIKAWAASVTSGLTKEVLEAGYLDVIEKSLIVQVDRQANTYWIQYKTGGTSQLTFKSYEQGRQKFQAAQLDLVHLDEEPAREIYTESLIRTMSTDEGNQGILMLTMTPLLGKTKLVHEYTDGKDADVVDKETNRFYTQAGWADNPHLLESEKRSLLASIPQHERKAREMGIASIGSGLVYPVAEDSFIHEPFQVPEYWSRVYALDFGYTAPTAALFGAYDRDNDMLYLTAEYYVAERTPQQHAVELCKMGAARMPGVYDPAGNQSNQKDGTSIVSLYRESGLRYLNKANNAKEAGTLQVLQRFQNRRLKIFSTLANTLTELRMYGRDEKGDIKKGNDHLMDCLRYMVMSGLSIAHHNVVHQFKSQRHAAPAPHSWMSN